MTNEVGERIFIACTVKKVPVAEKLQVFLSTEYRCRLWIAETFKSGKSALESLLKEIGIADYAVILLTADDDRVLSGGAAADKVPRDNLIFEAGLFVAALGRDRVALCVEDPPGVKLPSDLNGQNPIFFSIEGDPNAYNFQHVMSGVAGLVKAQFERERRRGGRLIAKRPQMRSGEHPLEFGDARLTNIVVDSAIQPANRLDLRKEIEHAIHAGRTFPTKFFYVTEEGANCWLALIGDTGYKFFGSSIALLRREVASIVDAVSERLPGIAPDLVSLGSGDGEKDAILLGQLCKRLNVHAVEERTSYFPIDFSYYLIAKTVSTIRGYLRPETYRIKPIIGDITDLHSFRYVYERYRNPNIFSILGNTIGNNDELAMLEAIRTAILPSDMVLLEVNTDRESLKSATSGDFAVSSKNLKHAFSPLSVLGIVYDESRFRFDGSKKLSACPNAVSMETCYTLPDGKSIRVSINHRYEFKSFCSWIVGALDCTVIWKREENKVGLALLFRPE